MNNGTQYEAGTPQKRVLVVGANSYIGDSFAKYAGEQMDIDIVDSFDEWKTVSFEGYDSILHCAGIAHVSQKTDMKQLYYAVNSDLAVEVAKKAKDAGVEQFIFLSSILVYGKTDTEITPETIPSPESFYGDSKLRAEMMLQPLADSTFNICIIRPPMVYGHDCKGNFPKLMKLAMRLPLFPKINNKRSMIYIENLCAFIVCLVDNNCTGIHLPQNVDYVNTTELVQSIAKLKGKRIRTIRLFNPIVRLMAKFVSPVNKLFGNLVYVHNSLEDVYNVVGFEDSIRTTVFGNRPIKITIVTSYYPPDCTSISYYYENIAYDLADYGADVTLVCGIPTREVDAETTLEYIKNPIEQVNNRLKIIRTGPHKGEGKRFVYRAFYHLYRSYCVYKTAKKVDTDVYFVSCNPPHMGYFCALLSKKTQTIYDLQDMFPDSLIASGKTRNGLLIWFFRKIERFVYNRSTHIRVISKDMAETLKSRVVTESKISLIYNWVDENNVAYVDRTSNPLFDNFQLSRDGFYVCYAGNIGLLQNLSTMLCAAEELLVSHPDIRFIIVGDGAWKPEMLKIVETKVLSNVLIFPMQPIELVPFVYNLGDIGVVTVAKNVTQGSMPSKTWNILSVSRPVICEADMESELAGIIKNHNCGICVAPDDYKGFANAVLELYNNKGMLMEMGHNARQYIEDHLTRKLSTKKIFDCAYALKR